MLFFGCQHEAADFYFRGEWPALAAAGALLPDGMVTAFSRDQPAKVYVGRRIRERGAHVWALLQQVGPRIPLTLLGWRGQELLIL